jgi:DNA repair exonuclease SbcCD nuclease subunit
MKFLHSADWQMGMKAVMLGEAGARVRDERLAAARRVIQAAQQHGVEFILLAGDLFEDNAVDRVLVQRVADILGAFEGPVFVLPGNHDPLVPGSVWEHPSWRSASNVHILREETPFSIAGGILYPCPVRERHSGRNPVAWIPEGSTDAFRIGLAHGTVEGVRQDEPDYPIPRDAASRAGLDYLALGHWHSYAAYPGPEGILRMAYSGTHETTRFGERDSGNVLVVEIPEPGARPFITRVRTGGLEWMAMEREIREAGDLRAFRSEIEALSDPGNTLIHVTLMGLFGASERVEIDLIEGLLESRFLWGRLDAAGLVPSPKDDSWISRLPTGVIREAALRLREHTGEAPEIAARALMELYAIVEEVSP